MEDRRLLICQKTTIKRVFWANSPWLRLRGLLGRKALTCEEGMLLEPCNSVHTIGMKYALDIIYLDDENTVVKIVHDLLPYRFSVCSHAKKVLELTSGNCHKYKIKQGDVLKFQK